MEFLTFNSGIAKNAGESLYPNLWDGLCGFWSPALGPQGSMLYDFSGRKHHAIVNVNPSYIIDKHGLGLYLNGTDGYIDFGNIPEISSAAKSYTLMAWITQRTTTTNTFKKIFVIDDLSGTISATADMSFGLSAWSSYPDTQYYKYGGLARANSSGSTAVPTPAHEFLKLVVIRNTYAGATVFILDPYGSARLNFSPSGTHTDFNSSHKLMFGFPGTGSADAYFKGTLFSASVHNRALSDSEVMELYTGASPLTPRPIIAVGYFDPNITVLVSSISLVSEVQDPMITLGVTVTPSVISLTSVIQSPLIVLDKTVLVDAIETEATVLNPTISISIETKVIPSVITVISEVLEPTITISCTIVPSLLTVTTVVKDPTYLITIYLHHAVRIISFNPLVIITSNSPLLLAKVDTTDPSAPQATGYSFPEVSNATDIIYDSIFAKLYVSCADGKLLEIDASDFTSYTVYDTGSTEDLKLLESLSGYKMLFASTDYNKGEIIVSDDSVKTIVSTDVRWSVLIPRLLNCWVNTTNASSINVDMKWSAVATNILGMDIRFNQFASGSYEEPIGRLDFEVYINNVLVTDVKMDAINITHTDNEKSRATFTLARHHDDLDYTLEDVSSEISNNNLVRIEINGNIEFTGYIWQIDANSNDETVSITAYSTSPKADERSLINLSLPSLNERLNLHHALINNPTIEKPYVQPDEVNPAIYKGVFIDGGYAEYQNIARYTAFMNASSVAESLTDGSFIPLQNWTYFWLATARNFMTGTEWGTLEYIGTSPTSLTGDTWEITGLAYKYQRAFSNTKNRQGTAVVFNDPSVPVAERTRYGFTKGEAPFKQISGRCGLLETVDQWLDKADGLYVHRDASYNYNQYALKTLDLEYLKIQNINGTVLPKTTVQIDIFIDAYYYYGISLLKRINIDNTIRMGIYKDANGFPVSVKSINIDSGSMKVTLNCDNQWSKTEMLEIEATAPDEDDYVEDARDDLLFYKFDPRTQKEIE